MNLRAVLLILTGIVALFIFSQFDSTAPSTSSAQSTLTLENLTKKLKDLEFRLEVLEESYYLSSQQTVSRFRRLEAKLAETSIEIETVTEIEPSQPEPEPERIFGIVIAPENRCSPYNQADYSYPQSIEAEIVTWQQGLIYSPYTGQFFFDTSETDIEHIVARSEAHDSGLCAASVDARKAFATDLTNLTLASPEVNRSQKRGYDLAEWLPIMNTCWYANRVVEVKKKYNLTMDLAEAQTAKRILDACISTGMQVPSSRPVTVHPTQDEPELKLDPLALYDDNGNGRITCAEARAHGIAPVPSSHPAYKYMRDGDGDGTVCE